MFILVFLGFPIAFTLMALGIMFGYYAYFDAGRMWRSFNRLAEDHGYDIKAIDRRVEEMLALTKDRPVIVNLAATMALEHYTAMMASEFLANPQHFKDADPEVRAMWEWHAVEEIEHKGLVYDVWLHATRDWSAWKRYKTRALIATLITKKYFGNRIRDAIGLLEQDGYSRRKAKWKLYAFLWWKPGMMRRMFFEWATILTPNFHPWKHDDRALIGKLDSPYADAVMPAE